MQSGDVDSVYLWRTTYDDENEVDYAASASQFLNALSPDLPVEGNIVLKPNVTWATDPRSGIIVHPEFVGGLIDEMSRRGVASDRIVVTEGHVLTDAAGKPTWDVAGYTDMSLQRGIRLLEVDHDTVAEVAVPEGVLYESIPIGGTLANAAMIINIPIAKCHNLGLTTLSMKNMMGMVAEPSRHFCRPQPVDEADKNRLDDITDRGISVREEHWCHKVCDLASAVQALPARKLHVVSGIVGRDGTGFATGNNYLLNIIAACGNPVRVDTVVTYLMGIDPLKTPYLCIAAERGLGTNRVEDINVIDLNEGRSLGIKELAEMRHLPAFVPLTRSPAGYEARFREDGTLIPWMLYLVNRRRSERGMEVIAGG